MKSPIKLVAIFITTSLLFILTLLPARAASAPVRTTTNPSQVFSLTTPTAITFSSVISLYLPLVYSNPPNEAWLAHVNYYRGLAGVPLVTADATLSDNCFQHARYMAENNHLAHNQTPNLPWASPAGRICAKRGNAWLGGAFDVPYWQVDDTFGSWMGSVGHRLWLLYPTTSTFGYGFYTATNNRAGAALDVLSMANFAADTSYTGWPIRYPATNQVGVPTTKYPITLNWPYFGTKPILFSTSLTTDSGTPIAHTANTSLPVSHKGVQILPTVALPDNSVFIITITGTYEGSPFSYTWKFSTGNIPIS